MQRCSQRKGLKQFCVVVENPLAAHSLSSSILLSGTWRCLICWWQTKAALRSVSHHDYHTATALAIITIFLHRHTLQTLPALTFDLSLSLTMTTSDSLWFSSLIWTTNCFTIDLLDVNWNIFICTLILNDWNVQHITSDKDTHKANNYFLSSLSWHSSVRVDGNEGTINEHVTQCSCVAQQCLDNNAALWHRGIRCYNKIHYVNSSAGSGFQQFLCTLPGELRLAKPALYFCKLVYSILYS